MNVTKPSDTRKLSSVPYSASRNCQRKDASEARLSLCDTTGQQCHTAHVQEPRCALVRSPERDFESRLGPASTEGFYSSSSIWDTLSECTLCMSLSPPGDGQHPVRDKRKENGAQRKYTEKKRMPAGPSSARGDRAGHPLPRGLIRAPLWLRAQSATCQTERMSLLDGLCSEVFNELKG